MYLWADMQVNQCRMINNCSGGEGIVQGLFMIFIAIPSILISTIVSTISFFSRRKNNKYVGKSHKILLYLCMITVLILVFFQPRLFLGLFNYMRDGVELILGI